MSFKDEILNGAKRFNIINENGEIINNNVSIELATEILQHGTALNKAFFDKLMSRTNLVTKFNVPSLELNNDINYLNIDLPLDEYDNMQIVKMCIDPQEYENFSTAIFPTTYNSNVKDGFVANTSSAFKTTHPTSSANGQARDNTNNEASIQCPIAIIPQTFTLEHGSDATSGTGKVTIYGSRDGSYWEKLIEQDVPVNYSYNAYSLTYSGNKAYSYFKVNMYHSKGATSGNVISNFNITSGKKSKYNMTKTSRLSIGNLQDKKIAEVVEPFKKYTLFFEDNVFKIYRG